MSLRLVAAGLTGALGVGGAYALPTVSSPSESPAVQVARLARGVCGDDVETVTIATAIGLAESSGRADAVGDTTITDGTWGPSKGIWQVRSLWAQRGSGLTRDADRLTDPTFNARSMQTISGGCQNWRAWSVYTNGAYVSRLDEARAAARTVLNDDRGVPAGDRGVDDPRSPIDKPTLGGRIDELYRSGGTALEDVCARVGQAEAPTLQDMCESAVHGYYGGQRTAPADDDAAEVPPSNLGQQYDGLQPDFAQRLAKMIDAAPGDITVFSGYRDPATQNELWQSALARYGSADAARQWVAPSDGTTCNSNHCRGIAADLRFGDGMEEWAHANSGRFRLMFPMSWEPWHIEPTGVRA